MDTIVVLVIILAVAGFIGLLFTKGFDAIDKYCQKREEKKKRKKGV